MVDAHTVPPHSPEAEDAIVAALLVSDYAARDVFATGIEPDDFWREKNRCAFAVCRALWDAGTPLNTITVGAELHARGQLDAVGGFGWLSQITTDLPTAVGCDAYARIVQDQAGYRRLMLAANGIGHLGYQGGSDLAGALAESEALLRGVRDRAVSLGQTRHIADVVGDDQGALEAWMANPGQLAGFRTGFAALDHALDGIEPGRVIMPAARTSVGKTMFALALAFRLSDTVPVLYLSLEMTAEQLKRRAQFARAVINRYAVRARGYLYASEVEAIRDAEGWLADRPLWLEDRKGHRWQAILACAESNIARNDVRVVIVDHLDLVAAGNNRENRHAQLSEVMADIKSLALRRNVAVLALSQVKRTLSDPPTLDDLRESGSKEEDSDIVLVLDRPATRQKGLPPEATLLHQLDVHILKNRDGETGYIRLWIDVGTQRLHDWNDSRGPAS